MPVYFVMLYHPDAVTPIPLNKNDFDMELFDTEEEADTAGKTSFLGEKTSYEVYRFPPED